MTAAPPFFLVGVIFAIAFIVIAFLTGLSLSWLGKHYPTIKIHRPFFSVYLIAGLALVVLLFFAAPQIAVSSVVSMWCHPIIFAFSLLAASFSVYEWRVSTQAKGLHSTPQGYPLHAFFFSISLK